MPSSLSASTQCRIVSQSDALPIRTATSDFGLGIGMDGKLTASPTDFHGSLYSVGNRSPRSEPVFPLSISNRILHREFGQIHRPDWVHGDRKIVGRKNPGKTNRIPPLRYRRNGFVEVKDVDLGNLFEAW